MQDAHYIIELVAQSHEENRTDLINEDVITVPVVDGPYNSYRNAEIALDEVTYDVETDEGTNRTYAITTIAEQDPDYLDVEITAQ